MLRSKQDAINFLLDISVLELNTRSWPRASNHWHLKNAIWRSPSNGPWLSKPKVSIAMIVDERPSRIVPTVRLARKVQMSAKWFFMAKRADQGRRFVIGLASE
jgi:hypothetical protein